MRQRGITEKMEKGEKGFHITICIVAYNEENYLPGILEDIKSQTYPHEKTEVLLIDSMSTDGTKKLMTDFADKYKDDFLNIGILENPGKILCCGWNLAIRHFSTDILVRVDAHAHIPSGFVANNVEQIRQGEMVVGGARPTRTERDDPWSRTLLMAEESLFGSSISDFRRNREKSYVKSIFHGAYRREVFEKAGGFNENLGRTEDNEFHYRVRKCGFRIAMSPDIISYQYIRPTLRKMLRQKYGNGYWIGLTLGVCPGCLSLYYFVPAGFVLGILITTVSALAGHPFLCRLLWGLYAFVSAAMSVIAIAGERKKGNKLAETMLALPFLFPLLHICYGTGTWVGLVKMPFWRKGK